MGDEGSRPGEDAWKKKCAAELSPPVPSGPFFAEIAGDPGPREVSVRVPRFWEWPDLEARA